jgi:glycosyltransferase involved in cell wall biosynthesis
LKQSILIFIDWFLPGYKAGGPIQSVANLVACFKTEFDISIVTSDRDLGDTESYANISLNQWIQKEGHRIMYLSPNYQTFSKLKSIFSETQYDVLYLNSIFSVPFTLKPIIIAKSKVKKIVLAPRGMLGKGALGIKPLKKILFLSVTKSIGLFKNIQWHATAGSELLEITTLYGKHAKVIVAPNLPSKRSEINPVREKKYSYLNLFFLSRISEKKNLEYALEILKKISSRIIVEFNIIGPVDSNEYWEKCLTIIAHLPPNIIVKAIGALPNNVIGSFISKCHFLFLPTLHENYGHVIIESLQCGCPVIISDQTPWRNLQTISNACPMKQSEGGNNNLSSVGVGWDLPLEKPEEFVKVIEYCAAMEQNEFDNISKNAFKYAQLIVSNTSVIEANRSLLQD